VIEHGFFSITYFIAAASARSLGTRNPYFFNAIFLLIGGHAPWLHPLNFNSFSDSSERPSLSIQKFMEASLIRRVQLDIGQNWTEGAGVRIAWRVCRERELTSRYEADATR